MAYLLTPEAIHAEIIPPALAPEDDAALDDEEDFSLQEALVAHTDNLVGIIDALEDDVVKAAGSKEPAVKAARERFLRDLMRVAGGMVESDFSIIVHIGLRIAAIIHNKGGDDVWATQLFDRHDEKSREEREEREYRIRALPRPPEPPPLPSPPERPTLLFALCLSASDILLPSSRETADPEAAFAYEEAVQAHEAMKEFRVAAAYDAYGAGALLPPNTPLGERIQIQAIFGLFDVAVLHGLEDYQEIVEEFGSLGNDPVTYPGANEILFHSYDIVTKRMRQFMDEQAAQEKPPDMRDPLKKLLDLDSVFLTRFFNQPSSAEDHASINEVALRNFSEHLRRLDAVSPEEAVNKLKSIRNKHGIDLDLRISREGRAHLWRLIDERLKTEQPQMTAGETPKRSGSPLKCRLKNSATTYCIIR